MNKEAETLVDEKRDLVCEMQRQLLALVDRAVDDDDLSPPDTCLFAWAMISVGVLSLYYMSPNVTLAAQGVTLATDRGLEMWQLSIEDEFENK